MKLNFVPYFLFALILTVPVQTVPAQPSPSIAGLYPTGESWPENATGANIVFDYQSDWLIPQSDSIQIDYPSLKLRDWKVTWSLITEDHKSISLRTEPLPKIKQPFLLRCQLNYRGTSKQNDAESSSRPPLPVLTPERQEAIRPELLLVPVHNISVPHTEPKPMFLKRIFGAKAPRRIASNQTTSPNVVILLIDTLRPDRTIPGGHPFIQTPHMEMLSSLGIHFYESYGASSSTRPSVGSIFTGLQPKAHGAVRHATDGAALYFGTPSLPEQFLQSEYKTAAVSSNAQISPAFGFDRGFETFDSSVWESQVTPKGIERLRSLDEPFFLYLHYMGPHQPYEPAPPWKGMYKRLTTVSDSLPYTPTIASASHALHDAYAEEISQEDRQIGLILKELCKQGLLDRTILWLVSDHGEEFWEHGWNGHGAHVFEEAVKTLSILFSPTLFSRSQTVHIPIMQVDMYSTLADLLQWKPPTFSQGKSLVPVIEAQTISDFAQRPIFLHHGGGSSALPHKSDKEAVLLDRKKLIFWPETGKWELYNLECDPFEQNNLYHENNPDVQQLKPLLENHLTNCKTIQKAVQSYSSQALPPLSAQEIENLRAHGYLNAEEN